MGRWTRSLAGETVAKVECGYRLIVTDREIHKMDREEYERYFESKGMQAPDGCPICSSGEDRFRYERDESAETMILICDPEAHKDYYDALERWISSGAPRLSKEK